MHTPSRMHRLVFLLAIIPWLPTQAAEWSVAPKIGISTAFNDNVRLTTADHDSVMQTNLDSSVRFGVAKRTQGIFGNAGFSIQRFTGGSGQESSDELNRENYFLSTNAYRNTPNDSFSAGLNITRDSTLDSELNETGNVDSSRNTRQSISLSPFWRHTINEKTQTYLSASLNKVTFPDDPGISRQVESDNYSLSSNLSYQMTPLVSGNLTASYSSFQPDTGFNSDTINLQAGISRSFSPTLSTSWLAGWRETTSDSLFATGSCLGADPGATFPTCTGGLPVVTGTSTQETENTGLVYSASIIKLLESGSVEGTISRSTTPTSDGELLDSTRVSMRGVHRISSRLDASLGISYTDNETIVNRIGRDFGSGNNKFLSVTPGISWQWDRQLQLTFRYEYAKNDSANNDDEATRNAVSVSLAYDFKKFSVAR